VQRVEHVTFREVPVLPGSVRGDNGFGSTGGHTAGLPPLVPAAIIEPSVEVEEMRSVRSATQRR
jgi:dUTP pyrophosphatase